MPSSVLSAPCSWHCGYTPGSRALLDGRVRLSLSSCPAVPLWGCSVAHLEATCKTRADSQGPGGHHEELARARGSSSRYGIQTGFLSTEGIRSQDKAVLWGWSHITVWYPDTFS